MKLYLLSGCPYCRMVLDKLEDLGLEYEEVEVPANHSRRKEVQKVSGQAYVPVLIDGNKVLDDENEIIDYLEKEYNPEQ